MPAQSGPKVAIAGGFGYLGSHITRSMLSRGGYTVTILTRNETEEKTKALRDEFTKMGAKIVKVDMTDVKKLTEVLQGHEIVVSTLGGAAIYDQQVALINAAKAAKVKRFVPSEFGCDIENGPSTGPLFGNKKKIREILSKSGLEYTYFCNGFFMEMPILNMVGFDPAKETVTFYGDPATTKLSLTSLKDLGDFFADSLRWPGSKNATVRVCGDTVTLKQLIETFEKAGGKKFKVDIHPLSEAKAKYDANPESWETIGAQFNYIIGSSQGELKKTNNADLKDVKPKNVATFAKEFYQKKV